jgi:alkylation response protein AidB-like acyl-CoA dehydrogenase
MDAETVLRNVAAISQRFAADRRARQMRRNLDKADFDALADAGYLLTGVPADMGGLWTDLQSSTRPICEILRTLAQGDPSVALVSAMHPAVTGYWLANSGAELETQKRWVAQTALDGHWWGTITSEPGSGGDVMRSRAVARKTPEGGYILSGQKHFGSGSGVSSYMMTMAIPEGEADVSLFFLDVRGVPWDGSTGMKLVAEWDGHGMIATQSHAFEFSDFPVSRGVRAAGQGGGFGAVAILAAPLFTAVVVGVVQAAVSAARAQVVKRRESLRPYEAVEWARIEQDAWLIDQAYEGQLRAIEKAGSAALLEGLQAKTAIAELAEALTGRICKVVGGGSFNRSSHFGAAFEDVRALGFLRPPWGLAYDQMLAALWQRAEA